MEKGGRHGHGDAFILFKLFIHTKWVPPQQPQFLLMDQSLLKHIIYQPCLSLILGKHSENQKYFKERNY